MRTPFFLIAAALTLTGCSSRLVVSEISTTESAGKVVDGIPFRMKKHFDVELYELQNDKYVKVATMQYALADPSRLYILGLKGGAMADPTLDLTLDGDNTIKTVALKNVSKGADALKEAGAQLNAVTTAIAAQDTKETTATNAAATAAIAADTAWQEAEVAALEYKIALANPNISEVDLLKAKNKERGAKLKANENARLAGKPPYYADVAP